MIVSARGLRITRGDRILFADFGLEVAAGELVHLHGSNGAGKTTILEVLAGLRHSEHGTVVYQANSAVHWVGHRDGLNPALNPVENLEFWCGLNALPSTGIGPALEQMGVGRQRFRACRSLSAGQRRRVALSRLLLDRRSVWLLDEPLAALDRAGIARVEELLESHVRGGGCAVVTSHQNLSRPIVGLRVLELAP